MSSVIKKTTTAKKKTTTRTTRRSPARKKPTTAGKKIITRSKSPAKKTSATKKPGPRISRTGKKSGRMGSTGRASKKMTTRSKSPAKKTSATKKPEPQIPAKSQTSTSIKKSGGSTGSAVMSKNQKARLGLSVMLDLKSHRQLELAARFNDRSRKKREFGAFWRQQASSLDQMLQQEWEDEKKNKRSHPWETRRTAQYRRSIDGRWVLEETNWAGGMCGGVKRRLFCLDSFIDPSQTKFVPIPEQELLGWVTLEGARSASDITKYKPKRSEEEVRHMIECAEQSYPFEKRIPELYCYNQGCHDSDYEYPEDDRPDYTSGCRSVHFMSMSLPVATSPPIGTCANYNNDDNEQTVQTDIRANAQLTTQTNVFVDDASILRAWTTVNTWDAQGVYWMLVLPPPRHHALVMDTLCTQNHLTPELSRLVCQYSY